MKQKSPKQICRLFFTPIVSISIVIMLFDFIFPVMSLSQERETIEITSSPNPVGSGARAIGMGGAFIAIADDATAASWNPAGLINLELMEASFVGTHVSRFENNDLSGSNLSDEKQYVSDNRINYLSFAWPFALCKNMALAVTYQHLYDFNREWDFSVTKSDSESIQDLSFKQNGGLSAIGFSYAIEFPTKNCGDFLLGTTINVWKDFVNENQWTREIRYNNRKQNDNDEDVSPYSKNEYSFSGYNANFGILWQFKKFSLGAVYKSPFKADVIHKSQYYSIDHSNGVINSPIPIETKAKLKMPMSFGTGLAYKIADSFIIALDYNRIDWKNFTLTSKDGETSGVTGENADVANVDATDHYRLGLEYFFINKLKKSAIPLRGGLFYDPAPDNKNPDDYFGFSIGSGFIHRYFSFDYAYQFRYGNNVGSSILNNPNFSQDVFEHKIYTSIIRYF